MAILSWGCRIVHGFPNGQACAGMPSRADALYRLFQQISLLETGKLAFASGTKAFAGMQKIDNHLAGAWVLGMIINYSPTE
jgi:hypothetical protein